MLVGKLVAGSVLAAGVTAAMLGAGTASADAGVSFSSNGSDPVGFGDQDPGGAVANSGSEGDHNNALADLHRVLAGRCDRRRSGRAQQRRLHRRRRRHRPVHRAQQRRDGGPVRPPWPGTRTTTPS